MSITIYDLLQGVHLRLTNTYGNRIFEEVGTFVDGVYTYVVINKNAIVKVNDGLTIDLSGTKETIDRCDFSSMTVM